MKLTGKVALITGGTRIGSAVARALARRGCRTAMTYLSSSAAAEDTARRIRRLGRKTLTLRADLSAPGEADRVVETVSRAWGGVDILVHLASVYRKTTVAALARDRTPLSEGPGAVDLEAAYRLSLRCAPGMARRGAGEVLLTSMDRDGTKAGFDLALTRAVSDAVPVPVIASGGVGTLDHLADGIQQGGADAVLAASIFHYGEFTVGQAKARMAERGIPVREIRG